MHAFEYIRKSKFIRSIFIRVITVFIIVVVAVVAWVSLSFTREINNNIVSERQKQLEVIESNISKRMEEASSIAYNISQDKAFYLKPVEGEQYSGYEMTKTLERYLVGNGFIEYLAYYRTAEADKIFSSVGELSVNDFWSTYLDFDDITMEDYVNNIKAVKSSRIIDLNSNDKNGEFFTYVSAVPQYSAKPAAYIIMLIPLSELEPIIDSQIENYCGEISIFDNEGNELYKKSNLEENIPMNAGDYDNGYCEISVKGKRYVANKTVSKDNDWSYISIIRLNDILSEITRKQSIFVVFLCTLMTMAVFFLLAGIIKKYKPINNLAVSIAGDSEDVNGVIDEKNLLTDTIATLKDDSEQKQKFEMAYHEANEANKAKSVFLSNMSHDIRTPMNAILGMTDIALENLDDSVHVKECLKKVKIASRYLLDIINNVLDMSRIESGKFSLAEEKVNIPEMVNGITAIVEQSMEAKKLSFVIENDGIENENIIGDGVRLTQIFMNIISNSVKFTPERGTISLRLRQRKSDREGYGSYTFTFSDTGIGMSAEFTQKVFETFSRAKNSGISKIEGTGLGMAIAKNLVEIMGGTITCESEIDEGTTFIVNLEMKLVEDEIISEIDKHRKEYNNARTLIIENSKDMCILQRNVFKSIGIKADYATNVTRAEGMIKKAQEEGRTYRYIIINQNCEDMSGIRTAKRLKRNTKKLDSMYVFAATSFVLSDQGDAQNAGIDKFLQLPLFKSSILKLFSGESKASGEQKKECADLSGHSLLLVDDNLLNREIAVEIIKKMNIEIVEASDGKEAVEVFSEHPEGYFDIILMDLQMPVMNGVEATEMIRAMKREDAKTVQIYALTANTFDEDVRMVKGAGMNGHIGKPYVAKELYEVIEGVIVQ